jgi:formate hydrogenlyase regulatory protein HycA
MAVPEVVPIAHEPGYRTDTIGRYADGQFYAAIHGADEPTRWFAYLHMFDSDGRYQRSDIRLIGAAPFLGEMLPQAEQLLAAMLDQLPDRRNGDIAIRPFRLEYDGVTFGLIDESDDELYDT